MFLALAPALAASAGAQTAAQASADSLGGSAGPDADLRGNHGPDRLGVGFQASSLGLGAEVAFQVTRTTNLRGGFSIFSYSRGLDHNGIHYDGDLRWLSGQAHYDWFPFAHFAHAFHLSPGLLVYNDNHVDATATVPGGNNFNLNHVTYESNPADPVSGTGGVSFNKVAPTILMGFGNLVPRHGQHFSVNIEWGIAFQGGPMVALNLTGSACAPQTPYCANVATTPAIQANVQGEQTILRNDLNALRYYPLVSLTLGYRF